MDNSERLKAMKRLYYYRKQAIKHHDAYEEQRVENEIEELRIEKEHDPVYTERMKERRKRSHRRSELRQLKSGYYQRYSKKYRYDHPDRVHKANREWYARIKQDPERYSQYLKHKAYVSRKRRHDNIEVARKKNHEQYLKRRRKILSNPKLYQADLKQMRINARKRKKKS